MTKDELLQRLADDIQSQVEMYWGMWRQPMKYRDLIPRFTVRLGGKAVLSELLEKLQAGQYCRIVMSQRGHRYVYPAIELDDDIIIEQLQSMDRVKHANERASDRARKARKSHGLE